MNGNKGMILSIFWVVLGIVLFTLSSLEIFKWDSELGTGMGSALIVVGALRLIRSIKYRKNPEYKEMIDTQNSDERNKFLHMKSWSWAGYITVMAEGAGIIVATVLGKEDIVKLLSYSVCFMLLAYWVAYLVLRKKY